MELKQLPDLCLLLESVCTARDFLLEVGGPGDRSLAGFMVINIRPITELAGHLLCRTLYISTSETKSAPRPVR